jgi:hypothetical protein
VLEKILLGKIFISYSVRDRRFVRNIAKRLWKEGYSVWLDEKELVPGDSLSLRLSEALQAARIVLVIVTPNSIKSNWVKFELSKATDRMVTGKCRIVPVLKGDITPPPELAGLVYADFKKSFSKGFKKILAALGHEGSKLATENRSVEVYEGLLKKTFDGSGMGWIDGEYKDIDYEFVEIDGMQVDGNQAQIIYEIVHDYINKKEPLTDNWWRDYLEWNDSLPDKYRIVVTERPWSFQMDYGDATVAVKMVKWSVAHPPNMIVTFVYIGDTTQKEERLLRLRTARDMITKIAIDLGDKKNVAD